MKVDIEPARVLSRVKEQADRAVSWVSEVTSRVRLPADDLRVVWFDSWSAELDAALDQLAARHGRDPDLHRIAGRDVGGIDKRHALVIEDDAPIALASLRRRADFWEPVTEGCLPVSEVIAPPDRLDDVLRATRLNIRIDGMPEDVAAVREPDQRWTKTAFLARLDDYEAMWRETGNWKNVRNARNKTRDLEVGTDQMGDIAPLVAMWTDQWSDSQLDLVAAASDMCAVSEYLFGLGRVHTVALRDEGRLVGGVINVHTGEVAYGLCMARDRTHPNKGLGTRILDESFASAAESGACVLDMATGLDYKTKWATIAVERHTIEYVPAIERWYRASRKFVGRAVRGVPRS